MTRTDGNNKKTKSAAMDNGRAKAISPHVPGKPKHRTQYDRQRVAVSFPEPSQTKQSFKHEVNVNAIMKRYTQTGVIEHLNPAQPNYGFAPSETYRESLENIAQAEAAFARLPAEIRKEMDNDPLKFLEFTQNPDNRPDMARMGLLAETATLVSDTSENVASDPSEPPKASGETSGEQNAAPT